MGDLLRQRLLQHVLKHLRRGGCISAHRDCQRTAGEGGGVSMCTAVILLVIQCVCIGLEPGS